MELIGIVREYKILDVS